MNVTDFTYLLQHPDKVASPVQTKQLEDILEEYPFFQAARAIHLKGLKNLNSYKYNNALKITAAYTADRDVLFDFITSKEFLQNNIANTISGRTTPLMDTEIVSEEIIPSREIETILNQELQDKPLPLTIKDAENILNPLLFSSKDPKIDEAIAETKKNEEKLEIGKPITFTQQEKYSFKEWLQLASHKPLGKQEQKKQVETKESIPFPLVEENNEKKKKFDLIDKFIGSNPKIVPKKTTPPANIKASAKLNSSELMTETLAKVYLEQKKFKKAIQAYKILSLKYPEKSSSFADRIKTIKKLQQENT
ncbi:MAG: hypothetical protein V3U92_08860 [Cellulophaga sp.]